MPGQVGSRRATPWITLTWSAGGAHRSTSQNDSQNDTSSPTLRMRPSSSSSHSGTRAVNTMASSWQPFERSDGSPPTHAHCRDQGHSPADERMSSVRHVLNVDVVHTIQIVGTLAFNRVATRIT